MWQQIENLIQLSSQPLADRWLENLEPKNPERRNYYRFLYHLVKWRQPAVILEIGVEAGVGSAHLAAAAHDYGGQVVGLDLNWHGLPGKILPERFGNYHLFLGNSTSVEAWQQVSGIVRKYGRIGLVYQDSSHHYDASMQEWSTYTLLLDAQAIWICDDITPAFHDPKIDPPGLGMVQYFDGLPGDKRLYQDVLHYGNRQGIILLEGECE